MAIASPIVLVVEPHAELRQTLKEGLGGHFEVIVAQTARGALVGFEHHTPTAVLMSMTQDSMHGFELSSRIHELDKDGRCLRVVYGTPGEGQPAGLVDQDFAERYGVHHYIPRGATLRKLEELISEHLRRPVGIPGLSDQASMSARAGDDIEGGEVDPRWNNPFTSTDVVSAKREEASGILGKAASSKLGWLFRR